MASPHELLPRQVADRYVDELLQLDPITGTYLGVDGADHRLPDLSPAGADALAALARRTLDSLTAAEALPGADADVERRCAKLLRERLEAELAVHDLDEHLRHVSNLWSPVHSVRDVFTMVRLDSDQAWADVETRLQAVPQALAGYRTCLERGLAAGLAASPTVTDTVLAQFTEWGQGDGWFASVVATAPADRAAALRAAADGATAAVGELRTWMAQVYRPGIEGAPDVVGRQRYAAWSRYFNGTDLDLDEAYAYGWSEYHRLLGEMQAEAAKILPDTDPWEVLAHLDVHGTRIPVAEVKAWLQALMDEVIADLDGTHFDLAEPIKRVEAMLAPPGGAAAPYYTSPSEDFSRPGRTWLPVMGETEFPVYDLVSTWYHEGVPGHHLQLAQWTYVADQLSRYQATVGMVSANAEGWALYAERLMDELGYLTDPERRLGYLDCQMMRACRVIIDIGMHLELAIPDHSPFHPGETWTPQLAREFFGRHSGRPAEFLDSELIRYLSMPAQAIGYKLGERAWLLGRERAQAARGEAFDLKAWHMAALSLGSLGLDDLVDELAALGT